MNEQEIIQIIANSGESKMKSFEALKCLKNKDFKKKRIHLFLFLSINRQLIVRIRIINKNFVKHLQFS